MGNRSIEPIKGGPTYRKSMTKPILVLGTAGLGGAWGKVDRDESVRTILHALKNGVTCLDTAPAYGNAQEIVGRALRLWKGKKPMISTKVGKLKGETASSENNDYTIVAMENSVVASRELLRTSQLDLLFLHEPEKVPSHEIADVVHFLVGLKKTGEVASLGLGGQVPENYHTYIREGIFDVVMGFNNLDACCLDGMAEAVPFYKKHGLKIYQGSALHTGLLGNSFEVYRKNRPDWISKTAVQNAEKALGIARILDMDLASLAHRYLLSMEEVDNLVLGAKNLDELKHSLSACEQGPLEEGIFYDLTDEIT